MTHRSLQSKEGATKLMETTTFGRTRLEVSVVGLGCGGHSRLGLGTGHDEAHATRIVQHALSLGINFIDTARAYGTEPAVGKGIAGRRQDVVVSTKASAGRGEQLLGAADLRESLELSLKRLGTDHIDIFNLHGVTLEQYPHCVEVLVPELERQRALGKIRFIGITERFVTDTHHAMLARALPDDLFDVVMVGFNLLNPSARERVFPLTRGNDVATQIMFAVRRALSSAAAGREAIEQLIERGEVDAYDLDRDDPLGFLASHPDIGSVVEAAYRFCRHEPGVHVVLTGTGSVAHLESNVTALLAPPLPDDVRTRLTRLFGRVRSASGN
jgi:aryl-alcohol dehydrogenase-like predicted oxidoreductase